MSKNIAIHQLSDLPAAAAQLLQEHPLQRIFAFHGQMGAGKTTFIKTLCQMLGVEGPTASPTYSLVNEYQGRAGIRIFHFDFYRILTPLEALDMGFEEYLDSGHYCFIEWPEKIDGLLPADCLHLQITLQDEERILSFRTI